MEFNINTNEGEYDLSAGVRLIGDDILVAIWGGEKPHIGAVAAAQPRPSLKDPNVMSSSASVICYLGHKEDELAKTAAETLTAALNNNVVVTAGIHWDNLSQEDIRRIKKNSEILLNSVLRRIRSEFGKEP
jgi:hypothetical protein